MSRRRVGHDAYRVAWICPLEIEQIAAMEMLDEEHESLSQSAADTNIYSLGSINGHNIVIAGLPQAGNCFAATVIAQMRMTFQSLRYALLVGIGGGVPIETENGMLRLGHVVVSEPTDVHSGVIQYDHGKARAGTDGFQRTGYLPPPPSTLRNAVREISVRRRRVDHDPIWQNTLRVDTKRRGLRQFKFPGVENDRLYQSDYRHARGGVSCEEAGCDPEKLVKQSTDLQDDSGSFVVVHRGTIASGEQVIKDAAKRDRLAQEHGVLCFEMEAAGVMIDFPCMVIRGISDYCDSHKNDVWHGYAAVVAAAYARELLLYVPAEGKESQEKASRSVGITPEQTSATSDALSSPAYYVIPSLANRHFTGREAMLNELRTRLLVDRTTDRLALFGLCGVGKTQVALQLAHWAKKHIPECSVFWVPALSLESFEQTCSQILNKIGINKPNDQTAMESVQNYLSSNASGRWLFIVDNADDPHLFDELDQHLPVSEYGATLLTTRSREIAASFAGIDIIELHIMTVEEGTAFLTKVLDKKLISGEEQTAQLLEELLLLPLAITQAAFYMTRNQVPISRYLEMMNKTEQDRVTLASREFHDRTRYRGIQNAVSTTWSISFGRITHSEPIAAEILKFLAYVEPKAIPRSMLPSRGSEAEMEDAIGTLCGYAFLTARAQGDMFDMHSLVQLSTRVWLETTGCSQSTLEWALQHMRDCFPPDIFSHQSIWQHYLPHATEVIRRYGGDNMKLKYDLISQVAWCNLLDSRTKEAVRLFEEEFAWIKTIYEEEDELRLQAEYRLATAYRLDGHLHNNGNVQKAIEHLENLVAVHSRTQDEEYIGRLSCQHVLATAYLSNGQTKQAIEILEHVVAIRDRTLAEENSMRIISQYELALAYQIYGQTQRAVDLLTHVVAIRERTLDEENPRRLSSQHALASAYQSNGQVKERINLLEHVVVVRDRILDEDHPDRVTSRQDLIKFKALSEAEV